MFGSFAEQENHLEVVAEDPKYANPKLDQLKTIILERYAENSDMRAIVFCKTREMTSALMNWMKSTDHLCELQPSRLTGGTSTEKGGR